jgi:hypothetical protein
MNVMLTSDHGAESGTLQPVASSWNVLVAGVEALQ